jgi:hypothetical protein
VRSGDATTDGSILRVRVTAFDHLTKTDANMSLLSLSARHPDARIAKPIRRATPG